MKPNPPKQYQAGTLTYSLAGLGALFFWLLWGDFCFTLMEVVWHSIVPLKIRELGAPNWVIGAIMMSIPQILNTTLNPIISTTSDRFRSSWGRRRPFMMAATPFIAVLLCVVGFSPDIAGWLHGAGLGRSSGWSVGAITVAMIAITIGLFRIAELFVSTLFYYFFNDVVPQKVMARFLALFRVVGMGAGALYNYFIFEHALSHMRLIFVAAGLLYLVGFGMMCWHVKEGEYPPPAPRPSKRRNPFEVVRSYAAECLQQKLYLLLYLHVMLWTLSEACTGFVVFLNLSLGLTMKEVGTLAAGVGVAMTVLTYPAGMIADRFHPLRLMVWLKFSMVMVAPLSFIWLFTRFQPSVNFWIVVGLSVIQIPLSLIYKALLMPLYMRLFPHQQFGQFCSFLAICIAMVGTFSGVAAGLYIDWMRTLFPDAYFGKDFCYRLIPCWSLFFMGLSLLLLALVYKEWRRLGAEAYMPVGDCGEIAHADSPPVPQTNVGDGAEELGEQDAGTSMHTGSAHKSEDVDKKSASPGIKNRNTK